MPGGFGVTQPKRRDSKIRSQESQKPGEGSDSNHQEPQPDLALQAEVGVSFAQHQQEHPEDVALAWSAGVYNPLANVNLLAMGARSLKPEEEDWLGIARLIGWLDVADCMDAIYFTAPPPDFALKQADWYVRPDLSSFLEEPILLKQAVEQYPIPVEEIQREIAQRFIQSGWTSQQQQGFFLELLDDPEAELTKDTWQFLLYELESRLQNKR